MLAVPQALDLAIKHHQAGRLHEAEEIYRQILQVAPQQVDALHLLGVITHQTGRNDEAIAYIGQALALNGSQAIFHNSLGAAYQALGKLPEAVACYEQALRLNLNYAEAHNNLGLALREQGRLDEAVASYQQALRLKPNYAGAHANLGRSLMDQGQIDEGISCLQRARQLKPDEQNFHSGLLGSLHYHPRYDRLAIMEELRRWELHYGQPLAADARSFGNDPSPERRLRIGYVSPDFRDHVVARNVWPLLRNHDPDQFEITLYANLTRADSMTEQFRRCAQNWCSIAGWPDGRVADRIRQDGIDILVDLALHTAGNRLLVFARKPAPVQVTFAGYPGSTGLRAIDYRLTDPYLDPPGLYDAWYAEQSYRLPHSFWCYDPQTEEPRVTPLPALERGFVTFGCLANFCKVNEGVLDLWGRVLRAVEGSRLLLLAKQGSHRQRTLDYFAQQGLAAERIEVLSRKPGPEYLALYRQLDIGLDTFPYNGHTTSLDSLWMGVPVITLVGNTVVGRAGLSQLTNLRLAELATATPESFVRLAVDLACDFPRLEALRTGLRERMRQSPLMDAVGFTRGIEQAYRVMWRTWCVQQQHSCERIAEKGKGKRGIQDSSATVNKHSERLR